MGCVVHQKSDRSEGIDDRCSSHDILYGRARSMCWRADSFTATWAAGERSIS